jgi:hypothetical protein
VRKGGENIQNRSDDPDGCTNILRGEIRGQTHNQTHNESDQGRRNIIDHCGNEINGKRDPEIILNNDEASRKSIPKGKILHHHHNWKRSKDRSKVKEREAAKEHTYHDQYIHRKRVNKDFQKVLLKTRHT